MSFTEDEYISTNTNSNIEFEDKGIKLNLTDPFFQQDLGIVIHTFERDCQQWAEEDYTKAYMYRDVYATENFSHRVREQMDYYPGMHQTASPPETDPLYTNAKEKSEDRLNYWDNAMDNPNAFMSGMHSRQGDFDYAKIFGTETNAKNRAENIGKMLSECIPCFDRLLDMDGLLPDGDLLEIHLMNIKVRTDMLDKIAAMFKDPGFYIDICSLLKLFSHLCPQDLLAILALLTQYLAKLTLEVQFNLDFIIQLVGPILSPFLDALAGWLDKWIQLLLNPLICVLDHINETILIAQQAKIPFSEVGANVGLNVNAAGPFHKNTSNEGSLAGSAGLGDSNKYAFEDGRDPYVGGWGEFEMQAFNTPEDQKYNPNKPELPSEETKLAWVEVADAWRPGYTPSERTERTEKWAELRKKHQDKIRNVPPPLTNEKHDGTRWSKDDIPNSEKYVKDGEFNAGYYPPEKQRSFKPASEYFVTTPIVQSIVELRNIMQGGIQYVKDWFTYITQMIYDLLGTDFGWMQKKTGTTILKSKIVQLIYMVKAIIEAVSKNGLECGTHTNFDEKQLKYILEDGMNKYLKDGKKFGIQPDGKITLETKPRPKVQDLSDKAQKPTSSQEISNVGTPNDTIKVETVEQTSVGSVVIKDCFKSVTQEEINKVRSWISDFEKRGVTNG